MQETTDEMYKQDLEEKLDLIFENGCGEECSNTMATAYNWFSTIRADKRKEGILLGNYKIVEENGLKYLYAPDGNKVIDYGFEDFFGPGFEDGYIAVKKEKKWYFLDKEGNFLNNEGFNSVSRFVDGYARVYTDEGQNIIDTNGDLVSKIFYEDTCLFHEGFAAVKVGNGWTFIDTNGKPIGDVYFNQVYDFKDGYARVRDKDKGYNYIDKQGNLVLDKWVTSATDFKEGMATIVEDLDSKLTLFTKNKEKIKTKYRTIDEFVNGYAVVRNQNYDQNLIDKDGKLVSLFWFYRVSDFSCGYAMVVNRSGNDYKYNYMDTKGRLAGSWTKIPYNLSHTLDEFAPRPNLNNKNLGNYQVTKTLLSYRCTNLPDYFTVKYEPVRIYGLRYVLCIDKAKLILFDRTTNEYKELGYLGFIEFDNYFIYDKNNKTVYFMYNDQMIDITDYYKRKLVNCDKLSISHDVRVLSKNDFFIGNEQAIRERWQKEKEKNIRTKQEHQKASNDKKLEELRQKDERTRKKNKVRQKEILLQVKSLLMELNELEKTEGPIERIQVDDVIISVGDHKEINPIYTSNDILRRINLSLVSFNNVKVEGIDFRGCNISFSPQEVYKKSLRNCNFEGIYIEPFMNFTGVDIRGAKFSDDDDKTTIDRQNVYFAHALYDETTTYNGIPFTKIYGECKLEEDKLDI